MKSKLLFSYTMTFALSIISTNTIALTDTQRIDALNTRVVSLTKSRDLHNTEINDLKSAQTTATSYQLLTDSIATKQSEIEGIQGEHHTAIRGLQSYNKDLNDWRIIAGSKMLKIEKNEKSTNDKIIKVVNDLKETETKLDLDISNLYYRNVDFTKLHMKAREDFIFNQINKNDSRYQKHFARLDNKINKTAAQANSGIASVAAMSNIPYAQNTRFSAGIGLGHYKNGKAIAAGAQYQIKENINIRSSMAWNNSDSAVIGGGVAMGW